MDEDYLLAVRLQEQFNQENSDHQLEQVDSQSNSLDDQVILGQWLPKEENTRSESSQWSVVDPRWETIDPLPDARALFLLFNDKYFWGKLAGVEVRWSPRMTLCAGLCCYEGRGGLCSVRLSEPLLKLRPRSDFVNTLLHEMVHAYLFVTDNNKDHDGHGPEFHKHMHRINKESGSNITVYHTFHDEVANYKQHWWKCDGPCQKWSPYYGMVKRAMNRAPHPRDPWFPGHKQKCGGTYHKVKEPEGYGVKKSKKKDEIQRKESPDKSTPGSRDIRNMFKREEKTPKEQKANKNKSIDLPPNVSVAPSHGPTAGPSDGLDDLPKFPGYGKSIGGSSQDSGQLGTIVRRIPGVGIITSRKPSATVTSAECMGNTHDNASSQNNSTNNSLDSDLNTTSRRMSDSRKRIIKEILDSDTDDDLFPVGSAKKRKPNSFDKFDLMDCTSPGAAAKIPGFKSVCDKSLDPSKFVSRAAGRNARALGLGSSSEESDDDCIPLGSVIKHTGDTRNDDKDTRQAKNRSTGRAFRELTDDSPPSRPDVNDNSGDRRTVEALPGLSIPPQVPAETMVNCPVCSLQLPQSQINMHLDTCLT